MPLNADNELEHEPASVTDPAHSASKNADHVTTSGEKPTSLFEYLTDASFIPTLDDAPLEQKIKSYLLLILTIFGCVATLWFFEFTLFQTILGRSPTSPTVVQGPLVPDAPISFVEAAKELLFVTTGASVLIMAMMFITGTANVDYWSLVMEYGWYTIPILAGVGLVFVISKESTEPTVELV